MTTINILTRDNGRLMFPPAALDAMREPGEYEVQGLFEFEGMSPVLDASWGRLAIVDTIWQEVFQVFQSHPANTYWLPITPDQLGRVRELWPSERVAEFDGWTGVQYHDQSQHLLNVRLMLVLPGGAIWNDDELGEAMTDETNQVIYQFTQFRPLCGGLAVKVADGPVTKLGG